MKILVYNLVRTSVKYKNFITVNKYIIFILSLCLIDLNGQAQTPQPALPRDFSTRLSIDTAWLTVSYACRSCRNPDVNSYSSDTQILEFGNKYIRYYSRNAELVDSLSYAGKFPHLGRDANGDYKEGTYEDIYINYPDSGRIDVRCRFMRRNLTYSEKIPEFEWMITSETISLLGYKCIKAVTNFRGRTWTVWFSPEIPLNYGPWKLGGLPGLILKAEDNNRYFTYEAIGITYCKTPVYIYNEKSQTCDRNDILMLNDLRWKDDAFLLKITSGNDVLKIDKNMSVDILGANHQKHTFVIPQRELE